MIISVNLKQFMKASFPILLTLSPIITFVKEELYNAWAGRLQLISTSPVQFASSKEKVGFCLILREAVVGHFT